MKQIPSLMFGLLALLIVPIVGWWRARSFENQRWADSDHPRGGGSDDDDDE